MEKPEINGPFFRSSSISNGGTFRSQTPVLSLQPNFSSQAVQEALEHLASIDLRELFNEAKIEYCRATRDLRSCSRYVQYALNSCGHASLCAECSQRCDLCPICRTPLIKSGNSRLRLRLFDECIDAGLISRRCDERFQNKEDRDNQLTADVQRLYSFFDVALENNLVSLVCHYVTDVCMDETAVSSDVVTALLLDEKVVKDWVKRTFKNLATELQRLYYLEIEEMKNRLGLLLKFSVRLTSLSSVLEVLESSFKGRLSAQLHDLHHLQESILKTKQHLEITIWCIRHHFLEQVRSRHADFTSWRNHVRERKSAAIVRAWPPPDVLDLSTNSTGQEASLFIEDALENLDIYEEIGEESDFAFLQKNGALSVLQSKIGGITGYYPFESLRAAVDILFLRGGSDLVVAKQAIFVYYLFDRHWSRPKEEWRDIVDDFAASFGINRHSLLESFIFCLLDDHSDEALLESCQLLPEISGPETHPKIAQVLLERQNPKAAQMVIRWSGRDGGSQLVSLSEAVTIVRVKVECGLLTEAFTYQRMLCAKVREKKFKYELSGDAFDDLKGQSRSWMDWLEALVTEFCCLCIRRNMVDRIIELPWNGEEEKYIHKCLLDCASDDPTTSIGSLLVVFYLQRYRYVEAYQVNVKLWNLEEDFISTHSGDEEFLEALSRMESHRQRRKKLVDKGIELLPKVLQQEVKAGTLPDIVVASGQEDEMPTRSGSPKSASLLVPSTSDSVVLRPDHMATPLRPPVSEIPRILDGYVNNSHVEAGNHGSTSILQGRLFADAGVSNVEIGKNFNFDNISGPGIHRVNPTYATPLKGVNQSSSRELSNRHLRQKQSGKVISEGEQNGFVSQVHNPSPPYSRRVTANPASTPSSNFGLFKGAANNLSSNISGKRGQSDRDDGGWNVPPTEDVMDVSWSHGERSFENRNAYVGLRWRSDETSDDEEQCPDRTMEVGATPVRGHRRRRFTRR